MRFEESPTLISLFTGAGGLDIGLERAGFRTIAAVECEKDCVSTLLANQASQLLVSLDRTPCHLERTMVVSRPIEEVRAQDLRSIGCQKGWRPDLLAGGPPCQPFSSAGNQRSVADPRGQLFEQFVRLTDELRPSFVLFENVRGLVTARGPSGEPGEVLLLVKSAFERIGYATSFALLNAADYGCPQRRVRCFMLASRDRPIPPFPDPTHAEAVEPTLFETRQRWVSLGSFLATQPQPDLADVVRPTDRLASQLAEIEEGNGLRSAGARETTRPGGHWGYRQGTFIADLSLPARTITTSASQDWIRLPDHSLRRLTWRECALLQGFPAEWQFIGARASQFRQIGNAVPVVFGEVLGRTIIQALASKSQMRAESAPLPVELLSAMRYTKKEQQRNGESRERVIRLQRGGGGRDLKGYGSREA